MVPPVATVAPIVESNSSSDVDSDDEGREDNEDFDDYDPFADSEDDIDDESLVESDIASIASSHDILKPSHNALSFLTSPDTGNCLLSHHSLDSDEGTLDGSSTDDSDQEDFLQLGASQNTTSVSLPHGNHPEVDNPAFHSQMLAKSVSTSFNDNTHQVQNSVNNSFPGNTIIQPGGVSFLLRPSESNDSDMVNGGSLSGPRVLHTDMVKPSSSHFPVPEPVFAQPMKSSLVGKRIAAGLGFHQNTVGICSSLAILPSKGGIHCTSEMSLPLDNCENISDGKDSSVSLDYSNIIGHVMSKSARVTSEDVSSPFSLVNTNPSNSQLNYKGLVSLANDQPQ